MLDPIISLKKLSEYAIGWLTDTARYRLILNDVENGNTLQDEIDLNHLKILPKYITQTHDDTKSHRVMSDVAVYVPGAMRIPTAAITGQRITQMPTATDELSVYAHVNTLLSQAEMGTQDFWPLGINNPTGRGNVVSEYCFVVLQVQKLVPRIEMQYLDADLQSYGTYSPLFLYPGIFYCFSTSAVEDVMNQSIGPFYLVPIYQVIQPGVISTQRAVLPFLF